MKLYIRNVDYTSKLLAYTLRIQRELDDSSSNFSLLLDTDELSQLDISNEVRVEDYETVNGTKTTFNIFGGVVSEMEYENYMEAIRVNFTCSSFNIYPTRFIVDAEIPIEPKMVNGKDRNVAGEFVKSLIAKYLAGEGIIAGTIQDGAVLTDKDLTDYYSTPLNQIFDDLADLSAFKWWIDQDKKLNFGDFSQITDKFKDPVIANSTNYREIKVKKELTDYRNKQYVMGGEPEEDVDPSYLDLDNKININKQLDEEVSRLQEMNGGNGIWANAESDDKLVMIADAWKVVDKDLGMYGKPIGQVEFKTPLLRVDPGDSFTINLPFYGIDNQNMVVESVEINDYAVGELLSTVKGTLRDTTFPRTNFIKFMAKLVSELNNTPNAINKAITKATGKQEDPGINRDGLVSWIDASDSSTVVSSGGKVLKITDKNGGGFHVAQPYENYQPSYISVMGSSFLEFDGTQYMGFQNNIPNARTVFIVYQDMSIPDDSSNADTLFIDGSFESDGVSFEGGGYPFDDNVFGTASMERINKSWVNTIQVAPDSVVRYRDNFVVLSFTLSDNLSINNLFKSQNDKLLRGRFAEILIYNRVLDDSEMDDMNNYLYSKWFS